MEHHITLPLTKEKASTLKVGDTVFLTGVLYTARDAAHKQMLELLGEGLPIPFPIEGAILYYVGPSPAKPGHIIGAAGPTTSYRMDAYTPALLQLGLRGMIGKGQRDPAVVTAMTQTGAVYFGAIGGAGALLADCVKSCEVIAFETLGPEAIHKLEVTDFPTVVVIDSRGNNLYETGRKTYLASLIEQT